jgi:hypothetical protein
VLGARKLQLQLLNTFFSVNEPHAQTGKQQQQFVIIFVVIVVVV